MKRAAKIGWACGLAIGLMSCAAVVAFCYCAFVYFEGIRLADAGYAAMGTRDYDRAAAKLQAALKKPLGYDRQSLYYNRGLSLASCRRFDEAIADLTQALRYPLALPSLVYQWRGWCYEGKHEIEKALADYDEAIRLDPNSGWTYHEKALIRFRKRDYDQALHDFDEAVRCEPNSAEALVMRARCYRAMNDLDHALASLDGAVAVDPVNAMAYMERSNVYGDRKEYEKRDRDHREALRLNSHIDNAWPDLSLTMTVPLPTYFGEQPAREWIKNARDLHTAANAAYDGGKYDEAIALDNDVLRMDVAATWASLVTMNRGNAYCGKRDTEKAMRDYNDAIKLDPKNAGAFVDRGLLLSGQGKHAEARSDFDEALRLNPKQWEAYYDRGADFRDERKLEEAIADFTKAIELNSKFAGSYVNRAELYFVKGELDGALSDCNKALSINPNLAAAYIGRARVYIRKKSYSEAVRDLKKAESVTEKVNPGTLNLIAWLQATSPESAVRDGQKAVEAGRKACDLTSWKNWAYIDTLAAAYAESGDFDQAAKYQEQVISLVPPSHPHFQSAKERLVLYRKGQAYREKSEE
jgi:tetratricopeptide (TPR) repeat protein